MNYEKIFNILAIRTDRFGEFILTLPAINALKVRFPAAKLVLLANAKAAELIKGSPAVDEVIICDERKISKFWANIDLLKKLKAAKFGVAVIFNPKKIFNILTFLAGIKLRVGYDRKWGFLLNRKIKDIKFQGQKHEVESNLDLVRLIGASADKKVFGIEIDKDEEDYVISFLKRQGIDNLSSLIAIHPWTSDAIKQWPRNSFVCLTRILVEELNRKIVLIGGEEERALAEDFVKEFDKGIINLVGKLNLRQLAALFKKIKFLISNDSGPVHLAAAVELPVIVLFQSKIPGKSAKRWRPYGNGHIVIEREELANISVSEVFEKTKALIKTMEDKPSTNNEKNSFY